MYVLQRTDGYFVAPPGQDMNTNLVPTMTENGETFPSGPVSTLDHRAKAYYRPGMGCDTILYSGHTTEEHAGKLLDALLTLPSVTGGHIERHVQGVGWVLAEDDATEVERRRIDMDPIFPHD